MNDDRTNMEKAGAGEGSPATPAEVSPPAKDATGSNQDTATSGSQESSQENQKGNQDHTSLAGPPPLPKPAAEIVEPEESLPQVEVEAAGSVDAEEAVSVYQEPLTDELARQFMFPFAVPERRTSLVGDALSINLKHFADERVMIVTCVDRELLLDLQYHFADYHGFRHAQKFDFRSPSSSGTNEQDADSYAANARIIRWKLARKEPTLSIVRIKDQEFLGAVLNWLKDDAVHDRNLFEQRDQYLLYTVEPNVYDTRLSQGIGEFRVWNFHFLEPLIHKHARQQNGDLTPQELIDRFTQRRAFWPQDEREFHQDVLKYVKRGGYQELVNEVEARNDRPNATISKSKVKMAINFITAFFEKLSPSEFEILIQILLKGEEIIKRKLDFEYVAVDPPKREGEEASTEPIIHKVEKEKIIRRSAYKAWQQKQDDYLNACKVEMSLDSDGKQYRDFENVMLREQVREIIQRRHSSFYYQQLLKIDESRLLFDPKTPPVLFAKLVKNYGDWAIQFPDRFGESWLTELVAVATIGEQLSQIVNQFDRPSIFYDRLALLCRELLSREETQNLVDHLIGRLLSSNQATTATIVFKLAQRLRDVESFDYELRLRNVLQAADVNTRVNVLRGLLRDAGSSPKEFERILGQLRRWLPPSSIDPNSLLQHQRYGLSFLFDYYWTFSTPSPRPVPIEDLQHSIFHDQIDPDKELVPGIAEWLTNEHLGAAVSSVQRDLAIERALADRNRPHPSAPSFTSAEVVCLLLERWRTEADELEERGEAASSDRDYALPKQACDALTKLVSERISPAVRDQILKIWRYRKEDYQNKLAKLIASPATRRERKQLQTQKRRVIELRNLFKLTDSIEDSEAT